MGSESMLTLTTAMSVPIGGPVMVIYVAVYMTVGSKTFLAKCASLWWKKSPIKISMQDILVKLVTPSGYVTLNVSDLIVKMPDSGAEIGRAHV